MPSYKVCYFEARGFAEMLRFSFAEAGVPYEDVRYTFKGTWPEHKAEMLFGQMPVLFVDGEQIAHSRASLRYLAREFNLDGGNSLNAGKADMWIEVLFESFSKLAFSDPDESKRAAHIASVMKEFFIPKFEKLNDAIQGDYIFGANPSVADFATYCVVDMLKRKHKEDFLENCPKVKQMLAAVEARPKIAKWMKERPVTES